MLKAKQYSKSYLGYERWKVWQESKGLSPAIILWLAGLIENYKVNTTQYFLAQISGLIIIDKRDNSPYTQYLWKIKRRVKPKSEFLLLEKLWQRPSGRRYTLSVILVHLLLWWAYHHRKESTVTTQPGHAGRLQKVQNDLSCLLQEANVSTSCCCTSDSLWLWHLAEMTRNGQTEWD